MPDEKNNLIKNKYIKIVILIIFFFWLAYECGDSLAILNNYYNAVQIYCSNYCMDASMTAKKQWHALDNEDTKIFKKCIKKCLWEE